jgi:SAM-dependent methyltransferase
VWSAYPDMPHKLLLARLSRAYTRFASPVAFVARRFIRSAAKVGGAAHAAGRCLDVGAGTAPYRSDLNTALGMVHYVSMDIAPSDTTGVVADGCRMPFPGDTFDMAVSFDVIQHVATPNRMLDEMARVVAPGGHILLTFPFLYPECDFHDFHRWTMDGMVHLLRERGLEIVVAERRGGRLFAMACMLNWMMQHAIPGQRRSWRAARTWLGIARAALVVLLTLPTTLLAWAALAVDSVLSPSGLYMGGAILARKSMRVAA